MPEVLTHLLRPEDGKCLKPFWRYYGGKWRAAPRYPKPLDGLPIVEPFAGAAGYSMRYYRHPIILIEKNPIIAGIWRYLITVSEEEVLRIPFVENVDDLPSWVPQEARNLVGFAMNSAVVAPCRKLSSGRIKLRSMGLKYEGWSDLMKLRVASQVEKIRHWKIIEGDYTLSPDIRGTWFIDPPYNCKAGSYYTYSDVDYGALGEWARKRQGRTIVCEAEGADWLPFQTMIAVKSMKGSSSEVMWTQDA